jgi:elongation factor P
MAKVQYNEILPKKTVVMDGDPYIVLTSNIAKKDRAKASNNVKMRNLRSGGVVDKTFHQADVLEEAFVEKRDVKFLYNNRGEFFFCPPENPKDRFSFTEDIIGDAAKFMKENSIVEALVFDDVIMSITVPVKVELKVKEAAPAVKGNTSSGATKEVIVETGATVFVPMFINEGDIISINTESGQYTERVEKA